VVRGNEKKTKWGRKIMRKREQKIKIDRAEERQIT
jgi:hypothetical protein